jgi:hypothetical protein
MLNVTPVNFWKILMTELVRWGSRDSYQNDRTWTPVIEKATREAVARFGCEPYGEYLKIDMIGYTYGPTRTDDDWHLHIAIEFENGRDWLKEFNKLAFIAADLRVLFAYQSDSGRYEQALLEEYLRKHPQRVWKVPYPWLVIFGPHWDLLPSDFWRPYTIDSKCNLIPLECETRLCGTCWDMS